MPREITAADLARRLENGEVIHLLDVRLPEEHTFAKLPGPQQLLPVQELPRRWAEVQPPPGSTLVVYCHHGVRSWMAAEYLEHRGLKDVLSLAGGIDAFSREVDPTLPRY